MYLLSISRIMKQLFCLLSLTETITESVNWNINILKQLTTKLQERKRKFVSIELNTKKTPTPPDTKKSGAPTGFQC